MQKFYFTHCIGTAGGDFTWYLQKQFLPGNMLCAPDVNASQDLNSPNKRMAARVELLKEKNKTRVKSGDNIKFIYGHVPFLSDFEEIFGGGFSSIALLRDPVTRFVSENRKFIYRNNTIDKFLEWERCHKAHPNDDPNEHNGLTYSHQTEFLSGLTTTPARDSDLEIAKRNLEKFAFVGIADQFDDSVKLFSKVFSIPYLNFKPLRKYKAKDIRPIDQEIISYIRDKSKLDIDLYNFGKMLFSKRLNEYEHVKLIESDLRGKWLVYPLRGLSLARAKVVAKLKNKLLKDNVVY